MERCRRSMRRGVFVQGMVLGMALGVTLGLDVTSAPAGAVDPQCASPTSTAPCDDGNTCTQHDRCQSGSCVGRAAFWINTRARLGNASQLGGDLSVNNVGGQLALGRRAHANDGVRCAADRLRLGVGARAFDVAYNTLNRGAERATIAGTATVPLALPIAESSCTVAATTCGGPDISLAANEVRELLAPQSYGRLRVRRGATLTLAPGSFAFCEITIARDARVHALGAGPTTIGVAGSLTLGARAHLGAGAGGPMPRVHVDGARVRLGPAATLDALLDAPQAHTRLGRHATINGTICAETLTTGSGASLGCAVICGDEILAPDEGCDDGNTADDDGCSASCLLECGGSVCAPGEICLGDQCFAAAP